jgi:hypothetical protein
MVRFIERAAYNIARFVETAIDVMAGPFRPDFGFAGDLPALLLRSFGIGACARIIRL